MTEQFAVRNAHVRRNEIVATIDGRPVVSHVAGTVSRVFARAGDRLPKGAPLVSIAPDGKAYVVADFNLSRLKSVRSGQPVSIRVDGFPQFRFHGVVAPLPKVAAGSAPGPHGSDYPATERWTTVRIDLDRPASDMDWLLGLPVRAVVDTRPVATQATAAYASRDR